MEIAQYSTRDHMMDVLVTNYKTLIDKCVPIWQDAVYLSSLWTLIDDDSINNTTITIMTDIT